MIPVVKMSDEAAQRNRLQQLAGALAPAMLHDATRALEHLAKGGKLILEAAPAPVSPAEELRGLVSSAIAALRAQKWSDALELLEQALARDPGLREQLTPFRATAYLRTGYPDLAARAVKMCRPEKLGIRDSLVLAKVMREAKVYDAAEELLVRIVEEDPNHKEGALLLEKTREELRSDADPVVQLARNLMAPMVTGIELVARGGMAIVCRGVHHRLKRNVAVKILLPDFANVPGAEDRFLLEAVTLINLGHKNLVEAYSITRKPGFTAYTMELLENAISTEHSVKSKGPFAWTEALKYLLAVTDALALCHKRKIVHKDIKPDNILFLPDGRIKLIDLGAAEFGNPKEAQGDLFTGTLRYSAPEVLLRKPLGPPADLYSLAVTFHDLVMGMEKDVSLPPDPTTFPDEARDNLKTRGVGRLLRDILHQCLDPLPKNRYPDAQALREELAKLPVGIAAMSASAPPPSKRVDDESVERHGVPALEGDGPAAGAAPREAEAAGAETAPRSEATPAGSPAAGRPPA